MGCLVALRLQEEGIDFTWSDIDAPRTAWKVSTGAVPVFGDTMSNRCRVQWLKWLKSRTHFGNHMRHYMAKTIWCYTAANPPHKASEVGTRARRQVGPVQISNKQSANMDVQSFVLDTRSLYNALRRKDKPRKRLTVITHGFGSNIAAWSWGWSAQVAIEMSAELQEALGHRRPCFYLRNGYQLPYLYPVGLQREYYAGTTLITQKKPKSLPIEPKLKVWKQHVEDYTEGHVRVVKVIKGSLGEGWRPMAHEDAPLIESVDERTLRIRPQYGNGIRHFPSTMKALLEELNG